jgi:hypothetical protein
MMVLAVSLCSCGVLVDDDKVKGAVEKQGYSDVVLGEKSVVFVGWAGCSDSDSAAYKVRAKNVKGDTVDLIVCAGWPFKGITVRSK